jgi:hypothetical protein
MALIPSVGIICDRLQLGVQSYVFCLVLRSPEMLSGYYSIYLKTNVLMADRQ